MMMSSENNNPLDKSLVIESQLIDKGGNNGKISLEEERDYFRQRCSSLKILVEEYQNDLIIYKERCRGVSTVQLLLKESRLEKVKLIKTVKALEAAISVLQKRLDKNGLSVSINTQDAELFVPGTSKQTFDNLAKENARLRSILKQENGTMGKKSADEIEELKRAFNEAEAESNELKNKIKDMEATKLKLVSDYEEAIQKLTLESQEEKVRLEKELQNMEAKLLKEEGRRTNEKTSSEPGKVQELKTLLAKTIEECSQLHGQLPASGAGTSESFAPDEKSWVSREDYNLLASKHHEAVAMNQKWQLYSKDREKQIQALHDKLNPHHMAAMIEDASNQKTACLSAELARKNEETLELKKQISGLSKDLKKALQEQSVSQDNSTVEILRQQIQVCTEDFNTERKDREKAVQRERALQEENTKLSAEISSLKRQIEQAKKAELPRQQSKPPSYETVRSMSHSSDSSPPPQYTQFSQGSGPRYSLHTPVQESPQYADRNVSVPFVDYSNSSTAGAQSMSPISPPVVSNFASLPRQPVSNMSDFSTPPLNNASNPDARNFVSMSRMSSKNGQSPSTPSLTNPTNLDVRNYGSRPNVPGASTPPPGYAAIAMPPLTRRGGSVNEEELTCPKCNLIFSNEILVAHIESCTQ